MKNKKKTVKVYASLFLGFGYIFLLLLGFGCWTLTLIIFLQGGNNATTPETARNVFIVVSCVLVFALITVALLLHRGFGAIVVSERGITKSLFRVFHKREIKWEELYELRLIGLFSVWLFASKSSLEGLDYHQIIKRKDTIQITFSKKIFNGIRQYCDLPLVGASDEALSKLGINEKE